MVILTYCIFNILVLQMKSTKVVIGVIVFAWVIMCVVIWMHPDKKSNGVQKASGSSCSMHTCGALDPVSEPTYNMKELIKQSALLEDHLADERKYCIDCVEKHFMSMMGYAQEALTLAGDDLERYPYMKESLGVYNALYEKWHAHKGDEHVRREVLASLREWRKKLMSIYL